MANTIINSSQSLLLTSSQGKTLGHYFLIDYIPLSSQNILNQVLSSQGRTDPIKGYEIPAAGQGAEEISDVLSQGKLEMDFPHLNLSYKQRYYEVPEFEVASAYFQDTKIYTFSVQLEIFKNNDVSPYCLAGSPPSEFQITGSSGARKGDYGCKLASIKV